MPNLVEIMAEVASRISSGEASAEDTQNYEAWRRNFDKTYNDRKPADTAALLNERGKTHGDFSVHAACTQDLKAVIKINAEKAGKTGYLFTVVQNEALDMICHKIGRVVAGDPDFRDHWDDIAGYAKLVADRCSK